MDSRMISFNLNCIMQLKQFYNIATKISSRKKCYYFWWSTWLVMDKVAVFNYIKAQQNKNGVHILRVHIYCIACSLMIKLVAPPCHPILQEEINSEDGMVIYTLHH